MTTSTILTNARGQKVTVTVISLLHKEGRDPDYIRLKIGDSGQSSPILGIRLQKGDTLFDQKTGKTSTIVSGWTSEEFKVNVLNALDLASYGEVTFLRLSSTPSTCYNNLAVVKLK